MLFGVFLTNVCYLLYLNYPQWDQPFMELEDNNNNTYILSTGMVLLWTVGGGLHTMYNLVIWHVAACACCQPGGCWHSHPDGISDGEDNAEKNKSVFRYCPSLGKHLVRLLVLTILVLATWVVLIRVELEEQVDDDHTLQVNLKDVHEAQEFSFLLGYLVEMGLALFLWYPIGAMLLFSGVLACGYNLPFLGGRPREVALERQKKAKSAMKLKRCDSRNSVSTSKTFSQAEDDVEINPVEAQSSFSSADDGIEVVWTPRARRQFEDSRTTP
jgi:hypothetical protein